MLKASSASVDSLRLLAQPTGMLKPMSLPFPIFDALTQPEVAAPQPARLHQEQQFIFLLHKRRCK